LKARAQGKQSLTFSNTRVGSISYTIYGESTPPTNPPTNPTLKPITLAPVSLLLHPCQFENKLSRVLMLHLNLVPKIGDKSTYIFSIFRLYKDE
jgi:hypothetical protein